MQSSSVYNIIGIHFVSLSILSIIKRVRRIYLALSLHLSVYRRKRRRETCRQMLNYFHLRLRLHGIDTYACHIFLFFSLTLNKINAPTQFTLSLGCFPFLPVSAFFCFICTNWIRNMFHNHQLFSGLKILERLSALERCKCLCLAYHFRKEWKKISSRFQNVFVFFSSSCE